MEIETNFASQNDLQTLFEAYLKQIQAGINDIVSFYMFYKNGFKYTL